MTKKELTNIKRIVKKSTGRNITISEIEAIGDDFIIISYYKSGYDRMTNNKTMETIKY